jgi:YidC/Oxa1 family membrane protein insertase
MKFYKENGVNPLAGCLPMIPQMIVFFALFSVLRAIARWTPGTKLAYGLTLPVVQSAQKATIFGVHLSDQLLFSHKSLPLHVAIVIVLTVVISASTTFMTVRQSAKRGLMQTNVDPDNPMAQSQKYMMYIVPFFSLTGLYWSYGLVLYWVTTNLWTLGQQFFMFRNWTVEPAGAEGATAAATTGMPAVRTGQSSLRPGSVRPAAAAAKSTSAKPSAGSTRPGSANGRTGSSSGRAASATQVKGAGSDTPGVRAGNASSGSGGTRTGSVPRRGTGTTMSGPSAGANGSEKRGLLRLGRSKPEPEPEPEVPAAKVVRQQPVRQAKSKRSGKR